MQNFPSSARLSSIYKYIYYTGAFGVLLIWDADERGASLVYTYLVLRWSWTYRCDIDSISHGFSSSLRKHFVSLGLVEGHGVEHFVNEIASESLEVSPCYAIHLHCLVSHRQELVGSQLFVSDSLPWLLCTFRHILLNIEMLLWKTCPSEALKSANLPLFWVLLNSWGHPV